MTREDAVEWIAMVMAGAMYGGYPADREGRLKWDKWPLLLQGAGAAIDALARSQPIPDKRG